MIEEPDNRSKNHRTKHPFLLSVGESWIQNPCAVDNREWSDILDKIEPHTTRIADSHDEGVDYIKSEDAEKNLVFFPRKSIGGGVVILHDGVADENYSHYLINIAKTRQIVESDTSRKINNPVPSIKLSY